MSKVIYSMGSKADLEWANQISKVINTPGVESVSGIALLTVFMP